MISFCDENSTTEPKNETVKHHRNFFLLPFMNSPRIARSNGFPSFHSSFNHSILPFKVNAIFSSTVERVNRHLHLQVLYLRISPITPCQSLSKTRSEARPWRHRMPVTASAGGWRWRPTMPVGGAPSRRNASATWSATCWAASTAATSLQSLTKSRSISAAAPLRRTVRMHGFSTSTTLASPTSPTTGRSTSGN